MRLRDWIKRNHLVVSIILFLFIFITVNRWKPAIMYNQNGELRPFGIGYTNKTIIPVWLFSIILAILCYLYVQIFIKNVI